ncbi:phosphoesterase, partial [Pseudomonas aeruginosa]
MRWRTAFARRDGSVRMAVPARMLCRGNPAPSGRVERRSCFKETGMGQWLETLTQWLAANPQWLGLALVIVACMECLAVVG